MSEPQLGASQVGTGAAPADPQPTGKDAAGTAPVERVGSLGSDAWRDLRRSPLFLVSAVIILVMLLMSLWPGLFTNVDPQAADLSQSNLGPSSAHWFGTDVQGHDVLARCIYGARYSLIVGVLATLGTTLVGVAVGIVAAYYGGWLDALLSRIADIFLGIPFVLGAIVVLTTFTVSSTVGIVALVIGSLILLGWPVPTRVMRSSMMQAKQADYVVAARSMGAGTRRIIFRHLLPNCLAPTLVYATISLGAFIGAEATLSYLGIGLHAPVVSWGVMISDAQTYLRTAPFALLFPAGFLSITVLAFVMLGDAVRQALDPKLR
ncbi:ABC transporter permease [Rhodococcus sp. X156]|uniref:ABC transporter permease n=1 Tax=Rhodococcus sp. X156 TaxID=2499145 RepID=UPI000FD9C7B2|nr:ABC transporter permease [Rhodococcus sp. X156]